MCEFLHCARSHNIRQYTSALCSVKYFFTEQTSPPFIFNSTSSKTITHISTHGTQRASFSFPVLTKQVNSYVCGCSSLLTDDEEISQTCITMFPTMVHFNITCHLSLRLPCYLFRSNFRQTFVCVIQVDHPRCAYKYSKTCLKRTPYIPETWTNGK